MEMKIDLDKDCHVYAGTGDMDIRPLKVYAEVVCDFLQELSTVLRKSPEAASYSDVKTFAFWCRKSNVQKLKREFEDKRIHVGRGLAFHITPSNVPVNFAFSLAFGLLSGNANVVRVPSKNFGQMKVICDAINCLWKKEKYQILAKQNLILSYNRDSEMTEKLSKQCNIRIIWGGDVTIRRIRQYQIQPRTIELVFADRFSFGVLQVERLLACTEEEMNRLAAGFYNDTYAMDQNACSTPHLLFFKRETDGEEKQLKEAVGRFWQAVYRTAEEKYTLEDIKVSDKYVDLCKIAVEQGDCHPVVRLSDENPQQNLLYVLEMEHMPKDMTILRGRFGLFFQYYIHEINEIVPWISQKVQSMMYFGISKEEREQFVTENHMLGIDRIVPFGNAMDVGVFWDGYDIISQMSRIVDIN